MQELTDELKRLDPQLRPDGWWITAQELDVRGIAAQMRAAGIRLATMTAIARPDGETDIIYHYAGPDISINLKTVTRNNSLPSLAPFLPAADWIEREIHDLYAVQFEGHPNLARLVRPPEVAEGFFRQPGGAAAKAARPAAERQA
jgi:NADH:ubiquinone oxidoreductase subunit C